LNGIKFFLKNIQINYYEARYISRNGVHIGEGIEIRYALPTGKLGSINFILTLLKAQPFVPTIYLCTIRSYAALLNSSDSDKHNFCRCDAVFHYFF